MDVLSLERANVLGISMGGRIALELALSCPGRVGRLVLVSSSTAGRGKVTVSSPMRLLPLRWAGPLHGKYPQPAMPICGSIRLRPVTTPRTGWTTSARPP
jgi:pimeloyl-ACP methyl ester carboxylesterase